MTDQETLIRSAKQLKALALDLQAVSLALTSISSDLEEIVTPQDTKLDIPHITQWGPTANKRRGDCGPACVAMSAHGLTEFRPTVDEAAYACRQPESGQGSFFTSIYQLRGDPPTAPRGPSGLYVYGLKSDIASPYSSPKMTLPLLKSQVDKGLPSISLIDYRKLRELTNPIPGIVHNQDQGYNFGHWVLFVGYSDDGVYVHDPDYWGPRVEEGAYRWIPNHAFVAALESPAQGNTYGSQGLIIL
jgi:hypothetical protein